MRSNGPTPTWGDILALGVRPHNVRVNRALGGGIDPLDPSNVENACDRGGEARRYQQGGGRGAHESSPIFVGQLAKVIVSWRPRLGIVGRGDQDDVVEGIVLMRKNEKSLPTANAVAAKLKEINEGDLLPKGMKIVVFNQRTDLVHVTTHNVIHNLVVGMVLVVAVLLIFLGDLTSAFIVALVIPLALLFAITVLYLQGKSANLLSIARSTSGSSSTARSSSSRTFTGASRHTTPTGHAL